MSVAGVSDEKIERLTADLIAHERPSSVIFSFLCETILACQITVVRDIQAECLDDGRSVFEIDDSVLVDIFCEELPGRLKAVNLRERLPYVRRVISVPEHPGQLLVGQRSVFFKFSNQLIAEIVQNVNASAVYIQGDVISVVMILMNQKLVLLFPVITEQAAAGPICDSLS